MSEAQGEDVPGIDVRDALIANRKRTVGEALRRLVGLVESEHAVRDVGRELHELHERSSNENGRSSPPWEKAHAA